MLEIILIFSKDLSFLIQIVSFKCGLVNTYWLYNLFRMQLPMKDESKIIGIISINDNSH